MTNLPEWIKPVPFIPPVGWKPSDGYWRITNIDYLEDPGANCNVYAIPFDELGNPTNNSKAIQRFPTWDHPDQTVLLEMALNSEGQYSASFNMNGDGSGFDPGKGEVGPQSIAMFGNSDRIDGIGLPLRRHVTLTATFQWTTKGPINPPAPPPISSYLTQAEFDDFKRSLREGFQHLIDNIP